MGFNSGFKGLNLQWGYLQVYATYQLQYSFAWQSNHDSRETV